MIRQDEDPFLTVAEVAQICRLSKMTVYRMINAGELKGVRFGRAYRVRTSALDQMLDAPERETGVAR